jgi:hypothetical protein
MNPCAPFIRSLTADEWEESQLNHPNHHAPEAQRMLAPRFAGVPTDRS